MINNLHQNLANNENVIIQKKNAYELFSNYNHLEFNDYSSDEIEPKIIISDKDFSQHKLVNINRIKEIIHNDELGDNKYVSNEKHCKKHYKQNKNINPENYLSNNHIAQFYFASLTIVGLYIIYQMIEKTK